MGNQQEKPQQKAKLAITNVSDDTQTKNTVTTQKYDHHTNNNNNDTVDLYLQYENERKLRGHDQYDAYKGSAFRHIPRKYEEVDGRYLLNRMPNKHLPKKTDVVDALEEQCLKYMLRKSDDEELSCKFHIPELVPGFPIIYDQVGVMKRLYERLSKRKGITVYASKDEENTLVIAWVERL